MVKIVTIFGVISISFTCYAKNIEMLSRNNIISSSTKDIILNSEQVFNHPAVLESRSQLEFVRKMINVGREPWISAFNKTKNDFYGSLDYKPKPWAKVECGPYSKPDNGCTDESHDSYAAYTQALLWYYTGNESYAKKSIEIMNAWANTLKGGHTNSNAPLQASWAAEQWPRAAEIIRYTYEAWSKDEINKFANMLSTQYLPNIEAMGSCSAFNWKASGIEGRLNIALFLEDNALYNKAIDMWRKLLPSVIYLTKDGPLPVQPAGCPKDKAKLIDYWYGQTTFVDGLSQETCRDFEHTAYGIAAIINVAETARIQGLDLYTEQAERITKAMEFHSLYQNGTHVPSWLCKGTIKNSTKGTFEIGYNHYVNRIGYTLPEAQKFILANRPTKGYFSFLWETLTHAETGDQ